MFQCNSPSPKMYEILHGRQHLIQKMAVFQSLLQTTPCCTEFGSGTLQLCKELVKNSYKDKKKKL